MCKQPVAKAGTVVSLGRGDPCAHDTEQRVPPLPVSIVTPVLASAPYSPALQHVSAQEGKTPGEIAEELNPDIAELFK